MISLRNSDLRLYITERPIYRLYEQAIYDLIDTATEHTIVEGSLYLPYDTNCLKTFTYAQLVDHDDIFNLNREKLVCAGMPDFFDYSNAVRVIRDGLDAEPLDWRTNGYD